MGDEEPMPRTEGLWMKVYERALDEPRIKRIARRAGLSEFDVFGRVARLWLQTYRGRSEFVDILDAEIVTGELTGFLDLVIDERMADRVDERTIRVRGAEDALTSLRNADDISKLNSEKGKKSGKKRRELSLQLQNRTAVQLGFDVVSTTESNRGSTGVRTAVELQDQIRSSETRSQEIQNSPPLRGSPQGGDQGAPPPSNIEPEPSQTANQPSRKPVPPQAAQLAERLHELVTQNNPTGRLARGPERLRLETIRRWGETIRKLAELDHIPYVEVSAMIEWCQTDPFWHRVILGAENLRDKWDAMAVQRTPRTVPGQQNGNQRQQHRPGPTELAMREAEELRATRSRP